MPAPEADTAAAPQAETGVAGMEDERRGEKSKEDNPELKHEKHISETQNRIADSEKIVAAIEKEIESMVNKSNFLSFKFYFKSKHNNYTL